MIRNFGWIEISILLRYLQHDPPPQFWVNGHVHGSFFLCRPDTPAWFEETAPSMNRERCHLHFVIKLQIGNKRWQELIESSLGLPVVLHYAELVIFLNLISVNLGLGIGIRWCNSFLKRILQLLSNVKSIVMFSTRNMFLLFCIGKSFAKYSVKCYSTM